MSVNRIVLSRQTKYSESALDVLKELKHATNLDLLQEIRKIYPEVSATTVHRVSARLRERGVIGCAPKTANGSERYDVNPLPHHHFVCNNCSRVCDVPETDEASNVIKQLENLSKDCAVAGSLTMMGICKNCANKEEYT